MAQRIGNLPVKAKVKDLKTKYCGEPIAWQVGEHNHSGYPSNSTTLVTEYIIKVCCFDAAESGSTSGGNARWAWSNIRQWLNKDSIPWYVATHDGDQPPATGKLYGNYGPYENEKGFLSNFSPKLRAAIKPTSLVTALPSSYGIGTETSVDEVFLLSLTEASGSPVTFQDDTGPIYEGSKLAMFESQVATRTRKLSQSAKDSTSYNSSNFYKGAYWNWFSRSTNNFGVDHPCMFSYDGYRAATQAYDDRVGILPAINVDSDLMVSDYPNGDGYYIVEQPPPATLGELELKDKVTFGSYYGAPIVWEIGDKNHAGYPANSVTPVSANIVKICCFDAKEPDNSNSDRRSYGNNRYSVSNIRQWLNSSAGAGQWYAPQHSTDAPPTNANVQDSYNEYDGQAGFLNTFTVSERAALLPTALTVAKPVVDGGGSETVTDKVFLLSMDEVGLGNFGISEGSKLAMFSDNVSRQCRPTAQAVSNCEYTYSTLSALLPWFWWLRTPAREYTSTVLCVDTEGGRDLARQGYDRYRALRLACNLSADTPIIPLADGTYAVAHTMPKTTGELPVGALVNAPVADGTTKQCIAVNQGIPENSALYDASCNGTWMLFKECTEKRAWHSSDVNDYENSTIHAYLNGEFAGNLDGEFLKNVLQAKIPYRPGSGTSPTVNSGANGLSCKVFLLSGYEMGWTLSDNPNLPPDGAKLSYFDAGILAEANNKRIAYFNGSATSWWLRSPYLYNSVEAWYVGSSGNHNGGNCSSTYGIRPAFVLPLDLPVEMQEDGSFNIVPNRNTACVIVDGVETPAVSSVIVAGVETPCACSKIINGVETPCA